MPDKISVLFCGGCKSVIDRSRFFEKLKVALPGCEFIFSLEKDSRAVVIINGCSVACRAGKQISETPAIQGKLIVIRGEMIDDAYIPEDELPQAAAKIIDQEINQGV